MIKNLWGKISYYLFLFILIIIGLFTGNLNIFAYETSGYGSAQYMDVTVPLVDTYGCFLNNTETSSSYYNFGTEHTFGNRRFIKITRAMINSGSYTWTKDNTYTFRFTLALNPKDYENFKNNSNNRWRVEGSTSTNTSGLSSANIVSNSATLTYGNYDNNNYWIYYDLTFTPAQNLKLLWIQFDWSGSVQVGNNSCVGNSHPRALPGYNFVDFQWYRIDYIRYVPTNNWENVNNSINNQTTIIENNFSQTNENINNINDSINSDDVDSPSDTITEFENLLPNNGVITQLIALPITWYQKILNSLNGSCQSFNLGSLYGTDLIMPCIELSDYLGSTLVNTIDLMITGFFILHIARKMIKAFENFTSMKEGDVIND